MGNSRESNKIFLSRWFQNRAGQVTGKKQLFLFGVTTNAFIDHMPFITQTAQSSTKFFHHENWTAGT
jgi:hypothetical protein